MELRRMSNGAKDRHNYSRAIRSARRGHPTIAVFRRGPARERKGQASLHAKDRHFCDPSETSVRARQRAESADLGDFCLRPRLPRPNPAASPGHSRGFRRAADENLPNTSTTRKRVGQEDTLACAACWYLLICRPLQEKSLPPQARSMTNDGRLPWTGWTLTQICRLQRPHSGT